MIVFLKCFGNWHWSVDYVIPIAEIVYDGIVLKKKGLYGTVSTLCSIIWQLYPLSIVLTS